MVINIQTVFLFHFQRRLLSCSSWWIRTVLKGSHMSLLVFDGLWRLISPPKWVTHIYISAMEMPIGKVSLRNKCMVIALIPSFSDFPSSIGQGKTLMFNSFHCTKVATTSRDLERRIWSIPRFRGKGLKIKWFLFLTFKMLLFSL